MVDSQSWQGYLLEEGAPLSQLQGSVGDGLVVVGDGLVVLGMGW